MGITVRGIAELEARLQSLAIDEAASLARTAVKAGMRYMRSQGVKSSPGRVKLEWGSSFVTSGVQTVATIGLGVGGYRGNVKRPHGKYLEEGTSYIAARKFASNALLAAAGTVGIVMARAARKRVEFMAQKG